MKRDFPFEVASLSSQSVPFQLKSATGLAAAIKCCWGGSARPLLCRGPGSIVCTGSPGLPGGGAKLGPLQVGEDEKSCASAADGCVWKRPQVQFVWTKINLTDPRISSSNLNSLPNAIKLLGKAERHLTTKEGGYNLKKKEKQQELHFKTVRR